MNFLVEKNLSRYKGKLIKIITNNNAKFDDYSPSPKIRKLLLHWGYKLTEKDYLPLNKLIEKRNFYEKKFLRVTICSIDNKFSKKQKLILVKKKLLSII